MIVSISNISKSYLVESIFEKKVLNEISFELNFLENNFISLIAPFGSGKTTLLKIIAGLTNTDSGKIIVNENGNEKILDNVVYIPTESISIPWMSVKKNIEFAIAKNQLSQERTKFIISLIGLEGYEDHIPDKDSFGFRFRIALGRALYSNPKLILLDEPFNKLDWLTKAEIFSMIKSVVTQTDSKFLMATSNLLDAIFLSDEVMFFKKEGKTLTESLKIEKSFSSMNEMLQSDFFNQVLNNFKSKMDIHSGYNIKDFSI